MNKLIKSLVVALLLMIFGTATVLADDISGYKHEEDVRLIIGLGIMEGYDDGSFKPDAEITRAEFATILMRTLGWIEENGTSNAFTDMNGHWAAGYVERAYSLGIASGMGEGIFAPDNLVLCQEGATFINNALGYKEVAAQRGEWPHGDLAVALDNGLLKGITTGYDKPLTRGEAAKMIANALEANTMEVSYGAMGSSVYEGDTLMECLGYTVRKFMVTSAWGGSIDSTTVGDKYYIATDGKRYKTTFTNGVDYLGMDVEAYIYDEGGINEQVRYLRKSDRTQIVSMHTSDIKKVTIGSELEYAVDKKLKTIKIPALIVIKNGYTLMTSEMNEATFLNADGNIYFIDNDDDDNFETAILWDTESYRVERISNGKIYCEYNKNVDLTDEDNQEVTVVYNGQYVSLDEIKTGDVIEVAKNKDNTKIRIEISRNEAYGEIKSMGSEKGKNFFNVEYNGTEEKIYLSKTYNTEYDSNRGYFTKPVTGDKGTFYLDTRGRIVSMAIGVMPDEGEIDETWLDRNTYKYGYLCRIWEKSEADALIIRVLTEDNELVNFSVEDKIKLGAVQSGSYTFKKVTADVASNILKDAKKQIVKYRVDENGNLTEFCLSKNGKNSSVWGDQTDSKTFNFANFQLEQKYMVDTSTICFYVPVSTEEDSWKVTKAVTMLKSGSSYKSTLYDIADGKIGVVLYTPELSTTRYTYVLDYVNSPVMLIDSVSAAYDELSGADQLAVSGWVSGEYKTVRVSNTLEPNSSTADELRDGNLIQYMVNTDKRSFAKYKNDPEEVILFNTICDFTNLPTEFVTWDYSSVSDVNARIKVYKGIVTYVDDDTFYVDIDGETYVATMHAGTSVMKYGGDNDLVAADIEDVAVGSEVLVRQRYNNTRDVFILE